MLHQSYHKLPGIETLLQHFVEEQHRLRHVALQGSLLHAEVVIRIQHIEHLNGLTVANRIAAEGHQLVKDTERITHTAVGFLRHDSQRLFLHRDTFLLSYILQMLDGIANRDTLEVIYLAAAQDGRQHLVFLRSRQDKDDIRRWFLQGLEQRVEGPL